MTKTITELVCEVAEFAKKHRWRKGVRKAVHGNDYAYCLLGYCDAVLEQNGMWRYRPSASKTYAKLVTRIASQLHPDPMGWGWSSAIFRAESTIIHFNDAKGRKKSEVVAVLDKACATETDG